MNNTIKTTLRYLWRNKLFTALNIVGLSIGISATTKKTGSGIGLTLSKQIMLVHNGNIFVNSEEDRGSTFTLQF